MIRQRTTAATNLGWLDLADTIDICFPIQHHLFIYLVLGSNSYYNKSSVFFFGGEGKIKEGGKANVKDSQKEMPLLYLCVMEKIEK